MKLNCELSDDMLRLRPLRHGDIESLRRWRNESQDNPFLSTLPYITSETQEAWFAKYLDDETETIYAIECSTENGYVLIGSISLYDWQKSEAECGRFLIGDTAFRNKGFGRKSLHLCLKLAFEKGELTLCRACAHPLNPASLRAYVNEGFRITGTHPFKNNHFEYELSLTRDQYNFMNSEGKHLWAT